MNTTHTEEGTLESILQPPERSVEVNGVEDGKRKVEDEYSSAPSKKLRTLASNAEHLESLTTANRISDVLAAESTAAQIEGVATSREGGQTNSIVSPFLRNDAVNSSPNHHFLPSHLTSSPTPISLVYPQQFYPSIQPLLRGQAIITYTSTDSEGHPSIPVGIPGLSFSNSRFKLKEQPQESQRKSYKTENRCLLPNPLSIVPREKTENLPRIIMGTVTARLTNMEGKEFSSPKQDILESTDSLTHPLDEKNSTTFSLKVTDTSEGGAFRLLFNISYTTEAGTFEEKILTSPFVVHSNRKKANRDRVLPDRPVIIDMKESHGPTSRETEVWIKGKGFGNRGSLVVVNFGDKAGTIQEVAENLITVLTPARPDIQQETKVPVLVYNKVNNEMQCADKKLTFTYIPDQT